MELSIREAKAHFTEAAAAAARGERVVVTKHGRPFIELVAVRQTGGMDFEKAAAVRRELGLDGVKVDLPADFDDPADVVAFALAMDWELLPLTARHATAELRQARLHKDPFDELLLVQAQEEGMRLLTRDARLSGHPVAVAGLP
jgi:prevent-host-death family protein